MMPSPTRSAAPRCGVYTRSQFGLGDTRYRCPDRTASHAHPVTTLTQMPSTPLGSAIPPKKPSNITSPPTRENRDKARSPRRLSIRTDSSALTPKQVNANALTTMCRKPIVGVCAEDRCERHSYAERRERPRGRARTSSDCARHTQSRRDHHDAAEREVRGLHPAIVAIGEHAQRMTREREAGTQQALSHADDEIERPDENAVAEQRPGDRRPPIESLRRSNNLCFHDDSRSLNVV